MWKNKDKRWGCLFVNQSTCYMFLDSIDLHDLFCQPLLLTKAAQTTA